MSNTYEPIDCGLHSEYELAIMHRQTLRITWQGNANTLHCEILTPVDLVTKAGEEFMIVQDNHGKSQRIRLDLIRRATPM